MRWFYDQKTATKLALGFGLLIALSLALGGGAMMQMAQMNRIADTIAKDPLPGTGLMANMVDNVKQFRIYEFRSILNTDRAEIQALETKSQVTRAHIDELMAKYEKTITVQEDRSNFRELKTLWNAYLHKHDQLARIRRERDAKKARLFIEGESKTQFFALADKVSLMIEWNKKNGERLARAAAVTYASAQVTILWLLLMSLGSGLGIAFAVTRAIAPPLRQMAGVAERLARGEVDQEIALPRKDEVGMVAEAFRSLIGYQKEMAAVAQAMADGDLTATITPKSDRDSLGNAFAMMVVSLRQLVGQVARSAAAVASTSVHLTSSAEQTGQAANEIARAIQEVASAAGQSAVTSQEMAGGSEQQARSATEAAGAMERLQTAITEVQSGGSRQQLAARHADGGMQRAASAVEEVARSAQQMAMTAQQAAAVAQTGGKAVEQTITCMGRIQEQVRASSERVMELGRKGQEIGAIIQTIDQISEQTNLLALNAAIEAARAGEHGKGFAVVADEVRKLAERATAATREISALIGNVRAEVEAAVRAMEQSSQEVSAGAVRSEEAGIALTQILQSAQSVAAEVQEVTATAQEMAAAVQSVRESVTAVHYIADENEKTMLAMASGAAQVSAAIANVASISQETAAGAEQMSAVAEEVSANSQNVSAAVEEQTASIEEVSAAVRELHAMAAHLQELVCQFTWETETTSSSGDIRPAREKLLKAA